MIFKECPWGWIHLLKAHWLYVYTTLVLTISDPSIQCAPFLVISSESNVTSAIPGKSDCDVKSNYFRFKNGVLGPVMENPLHWNTENCSYDPAVVIMRP